ncbi:MAG: PD-(D/E)XK nuclease family protein, partial [Bacteroidales bacterium]
MKPFLEEVCDHILEEYADITGELCVITPNRRAGLFFRKYFSKKITRPVWAPEVLSIEDFVNRLNNVQVVDHLGLVFEFYKVYKEIEKQEAQSIDEFFRWAPVLLSDFNEIDAQLNKPSELFGYLQDLKYIESWNPDGSPLTPFQQKYLDFFGKFEKYHSSLKQHLLDQQLAYQGLSFRLAINKLKDDTFSLPWKKVIFAGFNALTQSEEDIIKILHKQQRAVVITDSDPYYLDDPHHEAGAFIRKYHNRHGWEKPKQKASAFMGTPKNISIMGIARNVNQARLAGNLLADHAELTPDEDTAIVLANENLLIPMLYALPGDVSSVNVTMGYPLKKTNMYSFFNALIQLHLTPERMNRNKGNKPTAFYYKDLIRFFSHQATAFLWDLENGKELTNKLMRRLAQSNHSFCSFRQLAALSEDETLFTEKFGFLQQAWAGNPALAAPTMLSLCEILDDSFRSKAQAMQTEIAQSPWFLDYESLYYFARVLRRLQDIMSQWPVVDTLKTFNMLFRLTVNEVRLAFSGEPLEGLQIMGMLETRNLDFKNIILLSANEDILPKSKAGNSFIPFEVKKKFGLQVHTDKDATYAYHFYRLLQRASNIYLVYNTQKGMVGNQEKSRYITQLKMELPEFNPETIIREEIVALSPTKEIPAQNIIIEKTPEIMQRLGQMASSGFSPSALSTFINCPLQFYLQKVARLEEADQVEETLEASTMGTVVHAALETLYKSFCGKVLTPASIEGMKKDAARVLQEKFKEEFSGGNVDTGKNLLLVKVAGRMLENFLDREKQFLIKCNGSVLTILDLEMQLEAPLEIMANGNSFQVKVKGLADRIDRIDSTVRIIDYKTGKTEQTDLTVSEQQSIIEDPKMAKTFQLLCYTWLFRQQQQEPVDIESGIFSMKNMGAGLLTVQPHAKSGLTLEGLHEDFEHQLRALIGNIMDPA